MTEPEVRKRARDSEPLHSRSIDRSRTGSPHQLQLQGAITSESADADHEMKLNFARERVLALASLPPEEKHRRRASILGDPTFVSAFGMVVANARPEEPALHEALLWCGFVVSRAHSNGTLVEDVLFDQLLSSLSKPSALVHWKLLSDILSGLLAFELNVENSVRNNLVRNEFSCHLRRASAADNILLLQNVVLRMCRAYHCSCCVHSRSGVPVHVVDLSLLNLLLDHPNEYVRAQCLQIISFSTRPIDELTIFLPVSPFLPPSLPACVPVSICSSLLFSPLASYCHFLS